MSGTMRISQRMFDDRYRYDPLSGRWRSPSYLARFCRLGGSRFLAERCVAPAVHGFDITEEPSDRWCRQVPTKPSWPVALVESNLLEAPDELSDSDAAKNLILFFYLSPLARKYYHGPSDLTGRIIDLVI